MPFTIHPDQKPSDDESYWLNYYCQKTIMEASIAAEGCKLHAENARVASILQRENCN